jgi:hypothetical protein
MGMVDRKLSSSWIDRTHKSFAQDRDRHPSLPRREKRPRASFDSSPLTKDLSPRCSIDFDKHEKESDALRFSLSVDSEETQRGEIPKYESAVSPREKGRLVPAPVLLPYDEGASRRRTNTLPRLLMELIIVPP